jgi:uncharacterized NAD-dependent epimerase/dehydratase family protein
MLDHLRMEPEFPINLRLRIGDWPTLVVEPNGRVRVARPSERPTAEERRRLYEAESVLDLMENF